MNYKRGKVRLSLHSTCLDCESDDGGVQLCKGKTREFRNIWEWRLFPIYSTHTRQRLQSYRLIHDLLLGSFAQLLQFAKEHLRLTRESMKASENETKKTINIVQVILNWLYSTWTLQVQGPRVADCKGFLTKLLDAGSNNENAIIRPPEHNVSLQEAKWTWRSLATWKRSTFPTKLCLSSFSLQK